MTNQKNRLLVLRKERGERQATVAEKCGMTRTALSHYENGLTPGMENAMALASYYGVSLDYVLGLSNERAQNVGAVSDRFVTLAKLSGESSPTASDIIEITDAAIHYLTSGKPCGLAPLAAWRDFMRHLTVCFASAAAGNGAQLIDAANAAVLAALEITKMPAAFIGKAADT